MAGHRDQRAPQPPGHVLDEAGLAAAGGAFQQQRQALRGGGLEAGDLVAGGLVVRLDRQHPGSQQRRVRCIHRRGVGQWRASGLGSR